MFQCQTQCTEGHSTYEFALGGRKHFTNLDVLNLDTAHGNSDGCDATADIGSVKLVRTGAAVRTNNDSIAKKHCTAHTFINVSMMTQ